MSAEEKIVLRPPLSDSDVEGLHAGDRVLFNGVLYTARDAAHARLVALLEEGKPLPFPIEGQELFSIAGYPITLQGLMSPTHSISALKKVMIMNLGLKDVLPEISLLIVLTLVYFVIGVWAFQRRHMKVE